MTELARGAVADRPWGMTLGALGMRALTGQMTLAADGKRYIIAFSEGAVIGAYSPVASDAAVRIAMTGGLLSSSQVADIARRHQANPQRDEVDLIAEQVRLTPDQAAKLRRRAVAQRAARTFSLERGDFVVEDRVTLPVVSGNELDIRAVIFLGAKTNMSEGRLAAELTTFGSWFRLVRDALVDLPQYGFGRNEDPVLDVLEGGASLVELEMISDPHVVRAMMYALASCGAVETGQAPLRPAASPRPATREPAIPPPRAAPQQVQQAQARAPSVPPQPMPPSGSQRHAAPQPVHPAGSQGHVRPPQLPQQPPPPRPHPPSHGFDPPTIRRTDDLGDGATIRRPDPATRPQSATSAPRVSGRATNDPAHAAEVKKLITKHLDLLKRRVDHYALLGTHIDATPDDIRKAYFGLARQLHPDRLSALGIADESKEAQKLFAQVNTAFGVLSDPKNRQDYTNVLRRGGEAAVAEEQRRAEELTEKILEAEECFRRGEAALRRDQLSTAVAEFQRAMELNPEEGDYVALHAWAMFCASPDKMAVAQTTRSTLERAISRSPRAVAPRFYLGRVERMLGRDADALRHFQGVVALQPHHTEAGGEIRVIEQRLANPPPRRR